MTDLISRLRDLHMQCDGLSLYAEAADEIGRLTKKLEATQSNLCSLQCFFEDWKVAHSTVQKDVEIERLRAALTKVVDTYDAYRRRGVVPSPVEYADVIVAIEQARAAMKEPT